MSSVVCADISAIVTPRSANRAAKGLQSTPPRNSSRSRDDLTDIKRVRLPVDTRTVDNQDEVEASEDYESLSDRVRRGPLREVLLWTILVAGAIWVVLNAIVQIRFVWFTGRFASVPSSVFIWAQAVAGIANSVFLVALGSYIALWLALRENSG